MKYLSIVHKDPDSVFGVTLPDFPGVFSSAERVEDIQTNVQEAIDLWIEDLENYEPPVPSDPTQLIAANMQNPELSHNAIYHIVDINFDELEKKAVPVNITMPVYMRNRIDRAAKNSKMSRSTFLIRAAQNYGA